jgi:hypothetical protein
LNRYAEKDFEYIFLEDLLGDQIVIPDVCRDNPQGFKLMRLQCKGTMYVDHMEGLRVIDTEHVDLCLKALSLARNCNVDLFLTPEYSFPLDLVDLIIDNKTIQPKRGKMWCLACQSASCTDFSEAVLRWSQKGALVKTESMETCLEARFVNAMVYVFLLKDGRICIVPQLKTYAMSDKDFTGEQSGMSVGRTIFLWGKSQTNVLCTLLCADVLNDRCISHQALFDRTCGKGLIILHPQLNPSPRHNVFANLRRCIFEQADGDNVAYITSNWAYGTNIMSTDGTGEMISQSWSCLYFKSSPKWLEQTRALRHQNAENGLGFAYWAKPRVNIWYSNKEANLQLMEIKKPRQAGTVLTVPNHDVTNIQTWVPSLQNDWHLERFYHWEMTEHVNKFIGTLYDYPIGVGLEARDKFFGLCFGDLEAGQLSADPDEICHRLSLHIDDKCEEQRILGGEYFEALVDQLQNNLPPHISGLGPIHKFELCPTGHFNLLFQLVDGTDTFKALVAYIDSDSTAERTSKTYQDMVGENYRGQVCVFSRRGRHYPSYNIQITAPNGVPDIVDITQGRPTDE